MDALKCDICGGSLTMDISGEFAICDSCGMKYSKEHVKAKVQEIKGTVSVEGPVKVQSTDFEIRAGVLLKYHGEATDVVIPESVTQIGDGAFEGCSGLTSVVIPNSVTSIGNSSFSGCNSLTSVSIPESVSSIGSSAFSGCADLTSVAIPESVMSIGNSAFSGCTSLASVTIPDNVIGVGNCLFCNCLSLLSITIPNSVTSIGDSAFSGCTSLASVTISESVTSIGDSAFSGCIGLVSVVIPDSVTRIGDSAFKNCTGLADVAMPDHMQVYIGNAAFSGCTSLTSVSLPMGVSADSNAIHRIFGGTPFEKSIKMYGIVEPNYYGFGPVFVDDERNLRIGDFTPCVLTFPGAKTYEEKTVGPPNSQIQVYFTSSWGGGYRSAPLFLVKENGVWKEYFTGTKVFPFDCYNTLRTGTRVDLHYRYNTSTFVICHVDKDDYRGDNWKRFGFIESEVSFCTLEKFSEAIMSYSGREVASSLAKIQNKVLKWGEDFENAVASVRSSKNQNDAQKADAINNIEGNAGRYGNSKNGCYIATAVYGSYDCPQVWTLRRYRDNRLAKHLLGRAFIHCYYAISPHLVKWFGKTNWFQSFWKRRLDKLVCRLKNEGVDDTPYCDRKW